MSGKTCDGCGHSEVCVWLHDAETGGMNDCGMEHWTPRVAGWTREAPTVPGWYWWRAIGEHESEILFYFDGERTIATIERHCGLARYNIDAFFGGEWSGPISPPGGDS